MNFERRCWAEVDLNALRHNFKLIKRKAMNAPVMAVVKADAYGHGDVAVATLLEEEGADYFAVSGFAEAVRLRKAGLEKPILILGYTGVQNAATLAVSEITQTVYSLSYAKKLSQAAQRIGVTIKIHLKVDTGMGRIGFCARDDAQTEIAVQEMLQVCKLPGLVPTGIFTHFAAADSTESEDVAYTKIQYLQFCTVLEKLAMYGQSFPLVHSCNSAATIAYPNYHLNMVRPGIILYGHNPSAQVDLPGLQNAMTLKAVISMVKQIQPGDSVSYGCMFTAEHPMWVATLAIGYADGYPRVLSNSGVVSVHGKPARVLGRVCMDQLMVDVTQIPNVKAGDVAIIFGDQVAHSVEDIAFATDTIHYEILCDIGRRVPRVYTDNGKEVNLVNYLEGE